MILVLLPGTLAALSLAILAWNENHNKRIFDKMPRIHMEKREEVCLYMLPWLRNSEKKNKFLAEKAGWKMSGVFLGYIRAIAFLLALTLGGLIIETNNEILRNEIIGNMSIGKSFIELQNVDGNGKEAIRKEAIIIRLLEQTIPKSVIKEGGEKLAASINNYQAGQGGLGDEVQEISKRRLTIKLLKLYELKYSPKPWVGVLLIALLIYLLPIPLGIIKSGLSVQKRRDEIIRLYETMLLYGELPPYEIRDLICHMLNSAELYKDSLNKVLEGIKAGHSERILDEAIKMSAEKKDWSMADLLEHLKSFYLTGILSEDKDLERIIERRIKLEEIHEERKRNGMFQLTTIPFGIIIGLGAWYFMLGTMSLSNMSILGK